MLKPSYIVSELFYDFGTMELIGRFLPTTVRRLTQSPILIGIAIGQLLGRQVTEPVELHQLSAKTIAPRPSHCRNSGSIELLNWTAILSAALRPS